MGRAPCGPPLSARLLGDPPVLVHVRVAHVAQHEPHLRSVGLKSGKREVRHGAAGPCVFSSGIRMAELCSGSGEGAGAEQAISHHHRWARLARSHPGEELLNELVHLHGLQEPGIVGVEPLARGEGDEARPPARSVVPTSRRRPAAARPAGPPPGRRRGGERAGRVPRTEKRWWRSSVALSMRSARRRSTSENWKRPAGSRRPAAVRRDSLRLRSNSFVVSTPSPGGGGAAPRVRADTCTDGAGGAGGGL